MQAVIDLTLRGIGECTDPEEMFVRMSQFERFNCLLEEYSPKMIFQEEDHRVLVAMMAILASRFYEDKKMEFLSNYETYRRLDELIGCHMEDDELCHRIEYLMAYSVVQMAFLGKNPSVKFFIEPIKNYPFLGVSYQLPRRYDLFSFCWKTKETFADGNTALLLLELIPKLRKRTLSAVKDDGFRMITESRKPVSRPRHYAFDRRDEQMLIDRDN